MAGATSTGQRAARAVGELGEHVGGGGRDDDDVALAAERHVGDVGLHAGRPQVVEHGPMGDGLERQRLHEALGVRSEGHVHERAGLVQRAGQADRLVRGDAARDAERDAFACQDADLGYGLWHAVSTLRS
jgi:hypothetical protein